MTYLADIQGVAAKPRQEPMDFIVIGAQKCATSWLYDCLKDHPEIHLTAKKREKEYLGGDIHAANGDAWYLTLLDGATDSQKIGAVSVNYMSDPRSAAVVQRLVPNVALVASLRDPIDRAVSAYFWYTRKSTIPEAPLEDALREALNPSSGLAAETRAAYQDMLTQGLYDVQLERYLEFVKPDRFHVLLYDEIAQDGPVALKGVFRFLGVNEGYMPPAIDSRPKGNSYVKPLIALSRLAPKSRVMGKAIDLSNQFLLRMNVGKDKPKLSPALISDLGDYFRESVRETQRMVNEVRRAGGITPVDLERNWISRWGK